VYTLINALIKSNKNIKEYYFDDLEKRDGVFEAIK
jgi:hypothetical protein